MDAERAGWETARRSSPAQPPLSGPVRGDQNREAGRHRPLRNSPVPPQAVPLPPRNQRRNRGQSRRHRSNRDRLAGLLRRRNRRPNSPGPVCAPRRVGGWEDCRVALRPVGNRGDNPVCPNGLPRNSLVCPSSHCRSSPCQRSPVGCSRAWGNPARSLSHNRCLNLNLSLRSRRVRHPVGLWGDSQAGWGHRLDRFHRNSPGVGHWVGNRDFPNSPEG